MIRTMDHFTILTDRLEETRSFYAALGLVDGPRPDFGIVGAWLYAGDRPLLHVVDVGQLPEPRRGVLDHMAFAAEGLSGIIATLRDGETPYRLLRAPRPFSRWQLFVEDPNGAEVELDFDISETPPDDWKANTMAPSR